MLSITHLEVPVYITIQNIILPRVPDTRNSENVRWTYTMVKYKNYRIKSLQDNKTLTKDNQLASIYQRAPQPVSDFMVQLLALYRGKSLESELAKYPTKEFDTDDEFTWHVIGSSRRNIPLIEARYEDGTVIDGTNRSGENAGIGTSPFYLVFGEDWFARPIA